jgi:predicted porin
LPSTANTPSDNSRHGALFSTVNTCALAALAVVSAASAQSSVTISGKLDFSAITTGKTTTQAGTAAATTVESDKTGGQNAMSTGQISFAGTEDLGGGLKASFVFNSGVTAGNFGDRDKYLALDGGFGSVRIGRFIPATAQGFAAVSGYVSTSIGSIDDVSSTGTLVGNDTAAGTYQRQDGTIQYTSPKFSGFTLNASYNSSSSDTSATLGEAKAEQTGLSVAYANGPLMVAAGVNSRKLNAEGLLTANGITTDGDLNWLGASYDLGTAKLFASHVMRDDNTTSATGVNTVNSDINLTSLGVQVPMGAFTFAASAYTGKDDVSALSTDNLKMSGNQLSVTYALSKRTYLYALNGTNKAERDGGNTTGTAGKITSTSLGVVHSF